MKHFFIINPAAGKNKNVQQIIEKIESIFANRSDAYEIRLTEYPDHATELAAEAAATGELTRIYCIGGDGTLHEAVSGCYEADNIEIAPYPNGTGNDFVKGFPQCDFTDMEGLVNGKAQSIDLLKCGDKISMNIINCGFDAMVARNVNKFKKFCSGSLAYYIALFYTFIQRLGNTMQVSVDGETLYSGPSLLAVAANGQVYGGGFWAAPQAQMDDGLMDTLVVKNMSRLQITGFVSKYKSGNHEPLMHVIKKRRGKTMTICSDRPFAICFDGEVEMTTQAQIELMPQALRVVIPVSTQKERM